MRRVLFPVAVLAVLLAALLMWDRTDSQSERRPDIVVLLVDTLRADHLGAYGYQRDTSPKVDELARRGTVFTHAYSVSNWTNPAVATLLTGRYPLEIMEEARHRVAISMPLSRELSTFAELLRESGYRTSALVDHPGIKPWGHFDQGFEDYTMLFEEGADGGDGWGKSDIVHVADEFGRRLDDHGAEPSLVYLHVVYPHRPYRAPSDYSGMFGPDAYDDYVEEEREALVNAYDAEIRRTDDLVGLLLDALGSRGRLDSTWFLLVSDHGEGFWEHGFAEHGNVFYDEMIRVPLILVPPAGQGRATRVETPVSNLDIFPTILDIAGIEPPEATAGLSLLVNGPARSARSRTLFSGNAHRYDVEALTIFRDGYKLSRYPNRRPAIRHRLYHLPTDPTEARNLFGTGAGPDNELLAATIRHRERTAAARARLSSPDRVAPDEATLEALRALGYIQ